MGQSSRGRSKPGDIVRVPSRDAFTAGGGHHSGVRAGAQLALVYYGDNLRLCAAVPPSEFPSANWMPTAFPMAVLIRSAT